MQICTTKEILAGSMAIVAGAADARGTIPMLGMVLLKATETGQVSMVCSDSGVLAKAVAKADVRTGGETAVDVRRFHDLVRAVPDKQAITLRLDAGGQALAVESGRSRFRLPALPAGEYPRIMPASEDKVTVSMDAQRLAAMLGDVADAMADGDGRAYLNGALFEIDGKGLWIVATDGFRMSVAHEPVAGLDAKAQRLSVVPRKTVLMARKLLAQGGSVTLALGEKNIQMSFGDGSVLFCKAIEGKFPKWRSAVPSGQQSVCASSFRLSNALAMLMASVDEASDRNGLKNAVKMNIGEALISICRGESGVCDIDCQGTAQPPCEFMANIKFLSDSVRIAKEHCDETVIGFSSLGGPITVRPKSNEYPLSVVMPINK